MNVSTPPELPRKSKAEEGQTSKKSKAGKFLRRSNFFFKFLRFSLTQDGRRQCGTDDINTYWLKPHLQEQFLCDELYIWQFLFAGLSPV